MVTAEENVNRFLNDFHISFPPNYLYIIYRELSEFWHKKSSSHKYEPEP